jgi:hypothetical protein
LDVKRAWTLRGTLFLCGFFRDMGWVVDTGPALYDDGGSC